MKWSTLQSGSEGKSKRKDTDFGTNEKKSWLYLRGVKRNGELMDCKAALCQPATTQSQPFVSINQRKYYNVQIKCHLGLQYKIINNNKSWTHYVISHFLKNVINIISLSDMDRLVNCL